MQNKTCYCGITLPTYNIYSIQNEYVDNKITPQFCSKKCLEKFIKKEKPVLKCGTPSPSKCNNPNGFQFKSIGSHFNENNSLRLFCCWKCMAEFIKNNNVNNMT